ncbi:MAG: tol-pal system protein YbgF [Gammaproteobacteria bacterium]|nr:MAG: tol-pal system protein YbgF [Gammaproteobacteria bacterium]
MRALIASTLLFACIPLTLHAAAPVSEIGSEPTYNPPPIPVPVPVTPAPQDVAPAPVGDTHYQLQMLQDEVRTLRGMVEELNNDIKQLKARQLDDYMDLDRRLSGMSSSTTAQATPAENKSAATLTPVPASKPTPTSGDDAADYTAAYHALKTGKTAEATTLFKQHIEKYPSGAYTANAHYWLGEIYLLQNNLEQARQSFNTVISSYPAHRKAPDATFKLGLVYHLMGDNTKAKSLLEKAAAGNDNAAKLAQSYLRENF